MVEHIAILNSFSNMLKEEKSNRKLFSNPFFFQMIDEAIGILKNINQLIETYKENVDNNYNNGEKILNLFGLLQGLFVGIDCLYTIGKGTSINKIMINVNQNQVLREIKHIRNDVVGHPSYRYYQKNTVGFCSLNLDNLEKDELIYETTIYSQNSTTTTKHSVRMLNVIEQFYNESTAVLSQTIQILKMKKSARKLHLSSLVAELGEDYLKVRLNYVLLEKIKNDFISELKLEKNSNHRVLWRINLINYLFSLEKNDYTTYLTILEIYKLYSLLYQLEKQIDKSIKFYFPKFTKNIEFYLFKNRMKKTKNRLFDSTYLHDNSHPLYKSNFETLLLQFRDDKDTHNLRSWIKEELEKNDKNMLYLIGSELKVK